MKLDILIPTYNRHVDLLKNLTLLRDQIFADNLQGDVNIIVSDNCSPDATEQVTNHFIAECANSISVAYYRQTENVGLEQNVVTVLSKGNSPYVMFLGDDDYLPEGYLVYCLEKINHGPNLGCIIPGLASVLKDGSVIEGRKETFKEKKLDPGYKSAWSYSHLGHQMSGLVCSRSKLLENYLAYPVHRNIYLFIYFVTNRLLQYPAYYAPLYKVQVSTFNEKNWNYNSIGLLDEAFKSYYPFIDQYGENKVAKLMIRFLIMHAYRLDLSALSRNKIFTLLRSVSSKVLSVGAFKFYLFIFLLREYLKKRILGSRDT